MTETYTVSAQLNMRSNVPEVIAQMVRGFETVNRSIKETAANLAALRNDLRTLSDGNRGIGSLVRQMEKLSNMKLSGGIVGAMRDMLSVTREMQSAQAALAKSTVETARAYRDIAASNRRSGAVLPPGGRARAGGQSHANMADVAVGMQMGGDAGVGFFEQSIKAELEVQKLLASFRQNTTIKDSDMATIRSTAEGLVRSVPGTTIAENLKAILDAYTLTGSIGESLAGAKGLTSLNLLFKSLPGAHSGDPGFAAGQAVELMQRFYDPKTHAVNMEAFNRQIQAIGVVAAGTGGRDGPEAYLALAKQARVGSMVANDQFLYRDAPAAMIAMGGSRMGTGMAALFSQFETGTMTKNAANALKAVGLLDKNAVWKGGRVQDMANHLHGADLFGQNMVQWVRDYILGPQGALAQQHIDPSDKMAVARFLASFASRQTGLGVLAELTLGMGGVDKEGLKIDQTSRDPLAMLQANDPNMKVAAFHAAENEFMVTVGQALLGPAIDGLKALTAALRDMTDWAKANPQAAKDIALVAGGMALLTKAAGDLAMVVFVGAPVVTGMAALVKSLSPFAAGGTAEAAISTMASGGAGSLGTLAGSIVVLGAAVAGAIALPSLFHKLNDYLGIPDTPAGRAAYSAAHPSPSGNYFADGLKNWWNGFSAPQVGSHTNVHGVGAHQSSAAPIQMQGTLNVDGHALGTFMAKGLSGSTGTTSFDPRMTPMPTGATPTP